LATSEMRPWTRWNSLFRLRRSMGVVADPSAKLSTKGGLGLVRALNSSHRSYHRTCQHPPTIPSGRSSSRSPHRPTVHRNQQFPSGTASSVVYGGPQPHFGVDLLRQQEDYESHHRGSAHVITMGSMNVALCGLFFLTIGQ
jgi:hypothetical protein